MLVLGDERHKITALGTRLGSNLTFWDNRMLSKVRGKEVVEPGKGKVEEEIIACDTSVVGKNGVRFTFMNGRYVGRLNTKGKMGGGDKIVGEFEDNGKGGITQYLDEPFLPTIWSRGRTSISFTKQDLKMLVIKCLRPNER